MFCVLLDRGWGAMKGLHNFKKVTLSCCVSCCGEPHMPPAPTSSHLEILRNILCLLTSCAPTLTTHYKEAWSGDPTFFFSSLLYYFFFLQEYICAISTYEKKMAMVESDRLRKHRTNFKLRTCIWYGTKFIVIITMIIFTTIKNYWAQILH